MQVLWMVIEIKNRTYSTVISKILLLKMCAYKKYALKLNTLSRLADNVIQLLNSKTSRRKNSLEKKKLQVAY